MTSDVLILGGGIVGAACARAFLKQGLKVTIIERDLIGGGATAAGMGHIVVMDDSEAQFALTKRSRDLWDQLVPEFPSSVEFERRGTLWVAADEQELYAVSPKLSYYNSRHVNAQLLNAQSLYDAEPHLRQGFAGGFLVPDDSVIYAPCAAAWLAQGANIIQADVKKIEDGKVTLAIGDHHEAANLIIASGHYVTQLFPTIPIKPRKGHLAITDRYPGQVRHQLIELGYLKSAHGDSKESVAFNVQPRKTGQLLIGSSRQFGADHSFVEPHMISKMLTRAAHYLPNILNMSVIRTWTGFRAATADKLPLVGRYRNAECTWLATGHEGLGITTAMATAELLTHLIAKTKAPIDPTPYLPERFPQCRA